MKKNQFLQRLLTVVLLLGASIGASAQTVMPTKNGVRVNPSDCPTATEVQWFTASAVRILKYPKSLNAAPEHKSYSIIATPATRGFSAAAERDGKVVTESECLLLSIDTRTGNVRFSDKKTGNTLISEKSSSLDLITEGVDKDQYRASQTWTVDKDEFLMGLGQRQTDELGIRGMAVDIWTGYKIITIPYFTSEKGYGLYWDNAGESKFTDNADGTTFASSVARLEDYYFMYRDGQQDGVVAAIRDLTGQATMFPLWTLGYWQCRERYKTSDELCDVLDYYRQNQIPLDGIVQDWQYWGCDSNWNAMRFDNPYYSNKVGDPAQMRYLPKDLQQQADEMIRSGRQPRIKSPQEMVDYVHAQNAHLMISIWPDFGPWTEPYAELDKINALFPFQSWPAGVGAKVYDTWNPKARDIYWKYLKNLYDMGFDAWWTDSTEPDHTEKPGDRDYLTHDGSWRSVKNSFALVTNRGIYEHQRATRGSDRKRAVQMTRCATFGLQHYGSFSWSGDINSDWNVFRAQIPSGLNYIACGIPFWNTDIGGFFGWDMNNDPKSPAMQELQVRWMQFGAFCPLMRNHCSSPMVSEIYHFGKPGEWAYDVQRQYIELRYRLLPYLYATMGDVVLNSGSMMRPLVFDFANDKKAVRLGDEYMLGRQLLVKPVTEPLYTYRDAKKQGHAIYPEVEKAAAPVSVYLPSGTVWYDFWTNERHEGGHNLQRLAPIDIIPVYVRAGSILPWGPAVQYASEKSWDDLELRVYPGQDGTFTLYEDEGDNYNYEKGQYTLIRMTWDDASHTLTLAPREGRYKGMLTHRQFRVRLIGTDREQTVQYDGKAVKVTLGS